MERKPIALGEASVGLHFRNLAEIRDVQAIIGRTGEVSPLSVGLAGKRLHGQFAYTPRDIWMVVNSFDPEVLEVNIKDLTDPEEIVNFVSSNKEGALALRGQLPPRLFEPLNALVEFLDQKQKELVNLADINFNGLPWDVIRTTLWRRIFTPGYYQASLDWLTSKKKEDAFQRVHPHPAAFFPCIDLVVFSPSESSYRVKHDIGEESGVEIVTFVLNPFNTYIGTISNQYPKELRRKGIEEYTPLMQEAE